MIILKELVMNNNKEYMLKIDVDFDCLEYTDMYTIRLALGYVKEPPGEGCDAVDAAIGCVKDVSPDISVQYASVGYSLYLKTYDRENGIALLNKACEVMSEKIKEHGGKIIIKGEPIDINYWRNF